MIYIKITDYREYDSTLCNNGGRYSFTTIYYTNHFSALENGYCRMFTTSAEFGFCSCEGIFKECSNCIHFRECKGYKIVSVDTLEQHLEAVKGVKGIQILYFNGEVEKIIQQA